jgi:hypothetical protein
MFSNVKVARVGASPLLLVDAEPDSDSDISFLILGAGSTPIYGLRDEGLWKKGVFGGRRKGAFVGVA